MKKKISKLKYDIWKARSVYLIILPVVIYMILFKYWPMLASGEINHSETGENSQFQSDRKSQYTSFSFL